MSGPRYMDRRQIHSVHLFYWASCCNSHSLCRTAAKQATSQGCPNTMGIALGHTSHRSSTAHSYAVVVSVTVLRLYTLQINIKTVQNREHSTWGLCSD